MGLLLAKIFEVAVFLVWIVLWGLGGIWIIRSAFNLRKNEQVIAGLGLGLVAENWLANLVSQFVPVPLSFWLSAALVFAAGLFFSLSGGKKKFLDLFRLPFFPLQWLLLAGLVLVFVSIGRGQAISDDFQNLPVVSIIATGDIPPHFPLNPDINFGYHYFTMLFAGQLMRIADMFVWTAMDVARGVGFAISVMLMGLFTQRVTGSKLGGLLGGLVTMLAGGTRWLLLLLPPGMLSKISEQIILIGSGADSGADLSQAMLNAWASSGLGSYPFPFAFVNGFNVTGIVSFHSGSGGLLGVITGLLFLTHNKWRGWYAWIVFPILIASLGLANEVVLAQIGIGFVLTAVIYMLVKKTFRLPRSLWRWFVVLFIGGVFALFQGGVITALVVGWVQKLMPGFEATQAYHTFDFSFFFPPALLSTHLGNLYFNNPYHLLVLLAEIGPVLLLIPLVVVWTVKSFRYERWFEAAFSLSSFAGLGTSVIKLSGAAGSTALTRVQSLFLGSLKILGTPALWNWARHRSDKIKIGSGILLFITLLGGTVLLGIQLITAPDPVYSDFIDHLDAQMAQKYWGQLEPGAAVFDPDPYRAPVVLGRVNMSSTDYFIRLPEWLKLRENPDPWVLRAAGYSYIYLDEPYWDDIPPETRELLLHDSCVLAVEKLEQEFPRDVRWLLDIRNCE